MFKKWVLRNIKYWFDLYEIKDLQSWGYCGLCGSFIKEIFPKVWAWGLCEDCESYYE